MAGYKRKGKGDAWHLEVTLGTDFTGKRKRFNKTVHCKTEREADKELARFLIDCEDENFNTATPTTVNALIDIYVQDYVLRNLKRNSQISTMSHFDNWVRPFIGKRKVSSIKKYDIKQIINLMDDQGKSAKTIRNIYSDIKQLFRFAVEDLELITSSPCRDIPLPKLKKKESKSYKKEHVPIILSALDSSRAEDQALKVFVLLALFGGFRKGEILGFDWDDVNIKDCTLKVRQTRYRDSKEGEGIFLDTPKSEKSERTVSLPAFIFDEIKKLELQQKIDKLKFGQYYADSPALLRMANGSALNPSKPYKWFYALCIKNNLPTYGIHALRHTHASLLQSIGANYVDVSQRLGHSEVSTTLRIYTHLFEDKDTSFADQLGEYRNKLVK